MKKHYKYLNINFDEIRIVLLTNMATETFVPKVKTPLSFVIDKKKTGRKITYLFINDSFSPNSTTPKSGVYERLKSLFRGWNRTEICIMFPNKSD